MMMANFNAYYDIIGAKNLACNIYKQCVICRKVAAETDQ